MFKVLYQKRIQSISSDYLNLASTYSNKYLVKNIVANKCSQINVSKVISKFNSFDDIINNSNSILKHVPFVIKVSHWSGDAKIINNKDDLLNNIEFLKRHFNTKINSIYSKTELHYRYIIPYLFIEEYIDKNLHELKVHCIHGEPVLFNVIKNSNTGINPCTDQSYFAIYNTDWKKLNFTRSDLKKIDKNIIFDKPTNLNKIKTICKELTKGIDYVRLDMFITDKEELYFGEYTFTPLGLGPQFTNPNVDIDMLKIYNKQNVDINVFDKYIL